MSYFYYPLLGVGGTLHKSVVYGVSLYHTETPELIPDHSNFYQLMVTHRHTDNFSFFLRLLDIPLDLYERRAVIGWLL
jgi:hypothetical protein